MGKRTFGGHLVLALSGATLLSCNGSSGGSAKNTGYAQAVYGMLAVTRLENDTGGTGLYRATCVDNSVENSLTQAQLESNEVCRRGGTQQDPDGTTYTETIVVRTTVATRLKIAPTFTMMTTQSDRDSCSVAAGEEIHAADVARATNGHIQFKVEGAPPSAIDCFNRIQSLATNGLFYISLSDVDKTYEPLKSFSSQQ
jgi:hypothetical protein